MFSFGMLTAFARVMTAERPGEDWSPPERFDSSAISRANRAKTRDFAASVAAFLCLICAHLLCPDIRVLYAASGRECQGWYNQRMHEPLAKDFNPETGYILLAIARPDVPDRIRRAASDKGLFEKLEHHISVVATRIAPALARALAVNPRAPQLKQDVAQLVEETDWHYELKDEYYYLEEFYDQKRLGEFGYVGVPEHTRKSIVQMAAVPSLEGFYERLRTMLSHEFSTPVPHVTLYAWSDYEPLKTRGIGMASEEDFKRFAKEKL